VIVEFRCHIVAQVKSAISSASERRS
jgi:hypothetical protein